MQFAQHSVDFRDGSIGVRGSLSGADLAEYSDAVSDSWDARFVQLSPGALDANLEYLSGDRFVLYRESWSGRLHTLGGPREGMVALGIPHGGGKPSVWWNRPLPGDRVPFGGSNCELSLITEPDEAITVLTMDEEYFHELLQALAGLDPEDLPVRENLLPVDATAVPRLRTFWGRVLSRTARACHCPWTIADILGPLTDAFDLPFSPEQAVPRTREVVDRVIGTAEQSAFLASVPDVSARLGVSRRTIEYAFRHCLGESPYAYFTKRRLDLCYRDLIEASPDEATVTSVAMHHGFGELGRFASVYRRQFGELPSETLRRTRVAAVAHIAPAEVHPVRQSATRPLVLAG